MSDDVTYSVAVDVDGVLACYDGWEGIEQIGDPVPGARSFLESLHQDFEVIIHSTRLSPDPFMEGTQRAEPDHLERILRGWLEENELPYDHLWTLPGKPVAVVYFDDRAVRLQPRGEPGTLTENLLIFRDAIEEARAHVISGEEAS